LSHGIKARGKHPYIDTKFLRTGYITNYLEFGNYVKSNSLLILVDGENSGEVFKTNISGYLGSTLNCLHVLDYLYEPFIILCIKYYQESLRNSKKGAAIPHLNKTDFFNLIIGVPPFNLQRVIVQKMQRISNILISFEALK
jgi:type I restriction enzyme, S subunit